MRGVDGADSGALGFGVFSLDGGGAGGGVDGAAGGFDVPDTFCVGFCGVGGVFADVPFVDPLFSPSDGTSVEILLNLVEGSVNLKLREILTR
jgi:hypothetical protein